MKKLTNDPSRNVNAVSGMWVRLRKDGSKYAVRYVNARVRRVWSLSQTSQGTAWNVQADAAHAGRLPGAACSQCIHVRAFGEGPCDTARRLG